ncbi:carboxypeptidase-like regulatory domain-containing protein [Balneola vulgaris]|jgi:hypothetical protein|uniref:carboxypeptidase-like regulatory domain-containing protein n=1 Tax=Balneola vulgaris TaxID=287535 RepID=UPI000382CE04|nr:carboxypeptidase regulatory-like domain-containing protein [Balneola vulgaris]
MKKYHLLSLSILLSFLFVYTGCESTSKDVSITGQVVNNTNGDAIDEAVVVILEPAVYTNESKLTDENGSFTFSGLTITEATDFVIEARKTGFDRVTVTVPGTPGQDVTIDSPISLIPENTGGGDGGGDTGGDQVSGPSSGPAQIILTSIPKQAINIAETGDEISGTFTFQVQDSAGRPLTLSNQATVNFQILSGPGGGEEVTPTSINTNADGKVTTSLFSGNRAGPVKIQASITRSDIGLTIKSTPVLIAIHGGFPDANHFSISAETNNIEGFNINNIRDNITVIVGDEFSNPVKPGTVVYFETDGGVIQGSTTTDENGVGTVQLITANPRPANGLVTVTAKTFDKNDNEITTSTNVLFSGFPQISNVSPTTFDLPPNGGENFTFTATDENGNPLAAGTQFKVEVGEGLDATGDAEFTLGDYLSPGIGSTQFSFSISDTDEDANDRGGTTITIRVTTPSGKQASYAISGFRSKRINK